MCDSYTDHASEEALEALAMNKLDTADRTRLEQHLSACEDCTKRLRETEAFIRAIREAARRLSPELLGEDPAFSGLGAEPEVPDWQARIVILGDSARHNSRWLSPASFQLERPDGKRQNVITLRPFSSNKD